MKVQLPFMKENRSVSTTNEHLNQLYIKIIKYIIFRSRFDHCVAVLRGVLYVMGGFDSYSGDKTAERYDPKTNQWSTIADMNVQRSNARATALNGNMNIMKQEGIHTKCVAKWVHNVEVISVRQHANVLSVIAIRSWCLLLTNRKLLNSFSWNFMLRSLTEMFGEILVFFKIKQQ
jgi:hypothetical protein